MPSQKLWINVAAVSAVRPGGSATPRSVAASSAGCVSRSMTAFQWPSFGENRPHKRSSEKLATISSIITRT